MEKKLFLLDALALIYRAYYALIRNPRITSTGRNTNAQFGFTNTLVELINSQKPTHMAVCFDTWAPTERHADFADYKANRQETPEDLMSALPDIKRIIEAFNIPVVELDGYEADDVIGTLAWQACKTGYNVYMVTPDKDYGQLVNECVYIYKPGYQGGDVEIMGPQEICKKWDIERVDQVIDILGLMGDAVDNIPGIPGVGEKTASKLLKEYGSLENIIANADSIKGALGDKVRNGKDMAIMSKQLATIITDVPVEFHEENFRMKDWNKEALLELFIEFEFKSIAQRVLNETISVGSRSVDKSQSNVIQTDLFGSVAEQPVKPAPAPVKTQPEQIENTSDIHAERNINNTPHNYELIDSNEKIDALIHKLMPVAEISFDTETTHIDANCAELVGLSFCIAAGEGYYVPCPADQETTTAIVKRFESLFKDPSKVWVGQNIKYDLLMLKWYGMEVAGDVYDTMLAHYVIEPDGRRNMDLLSAQYLGYQPIALGDLLGKKGKGQGTMRDVEVEKAKEYAIEDADITLQLKHKFSPLVIERDVTKVLNEVEMPLLKVLRDMEYEGVRIDESFLNDYSRELEREARIAEAKVYDFAGVRFNLASPKQLGEVLFDKLKLDPSAKKTKTGQYQTGEDVLGRLAVRGHEIVDSILAFRELTKLKSTYVDALPLLINSKTGRLHTNYAQAVAVTGRLSSNNPNLQNIPVRTDRGKEIRKAFIPRDNNHVLLSADYSQIELRIVAAISGDPNMCEAFRLSKDIHTATAAKVFSVAEADVTKEMRYKAKSVNFGIIYGQGAFGLADNLGISRSEAKVIIDNYKKEFASIQKYMDDTVNFARERGYVQTLMGRKRWLRDIGSSNFTVRSFAERNAINSPIQGTAADMIKLAMIKVHEAIRKQNMRSKMILQVHDELVFDAVKDELNELKPLVLECMRSAMILPNGVPVEADAGEGDNWLEAH
jgi:DNA polymerase-1